MWKCLCLLFSLFFLAGCGKSWDVGNVDLDVVPVADENHMLNVELDNDEVQALIMAIDDEYKARATYGAVVEKFGEISPFVNIIEAEQKHVDELLVLFEKYEVSVPNDNWEINPDDFETRESACTVGVNAEMGNVLLYDMLLPKIKHQDIVDVFEKLQDASENNHLSAFEKCGG